jgi:hypothetical protein
MATNKLRHSGMDCRNPETKDGIHAAWMPSFPDGMPGFGYIDALIVNRP